MSISTGDRYPDAELLKCTDDGPQAISLSEYLAGRKVVIFALPGAFTGPCSTSHLPSFIRTADQIRARGVDEIICLAVNDPFTLKAWADQLGATQAGITMIADYAAEVTLALDMAFTAPPIGLVNRSNRYALLLEDGVVTQAMVDAPSVCDISRGEQFLEAMAA
jgi:peroxiredoxin